MSNEDFARNPKTPPEALAMLSTSPSAEVRRLVALNPSTPVAALRFLAADEDKAVREAVSTNPMTPYDAFAAKEAPPAPVDNPMSEETADNLTGDDFITDEDAEETRAAPVNSQPQEAGPSPAAGASSQDTMPAAFAPVAEVQRPVSLWQRFLALLGLSR